MDQTPHASSSRARPVGAGKRRPLPSQAHLAEEMGRLMFLIDRVLIDQDLEEIRTLADGRLLETAA